MDKTVKSKLISDIENRLDVFFGEPTESPATPDSDPSLEKLKSAVLSIDWEITDACLTDLIAETERLLPRFKADPITRALLRMLQALGGYIRKRKAQAHQDAIKRVMSVFASLETLVEDRRMSDQQRQRIVAKEIKAFKLLKSQVEAQRTVRNQPASPEQLPPEPTETPSAPPSDLNALLEHQGFKKAMLAVEERLNSQVAALKAELAFLQREVETLRRE